MVLKSKRTEVPFQKKIHKSGVFQPGEIVVDAQSNVVGIVYTVGPEGVVLGVYLDQEDVLFFLEKHVLLSDCCLAEHAEMLRLQRAFYRKGIAWDRRRCMLFKREQEIRDNQQVRLSLLGRRLGYGVFKEIDGKGRVVMYCMKLEGEDARFSLHEVLGTAEDFQMDPISTYERKIFADELASFGIAWNGHIKQVERISYRMPKGEAYYYVNDLFDVVQTTDQYRSRDSRRLKVGNYFINDKSARKFREFVIREATKGISKSGTVSANGLRGVVNRSKLVDVKPGVCSKSV